MGTNIYVIQKQKLSDWQKQLDRDIAESIPRLWPLIEEYYQWKKPQPIHIGKRSAGWRFLFNHNDWKYFQSIEEMKTFLKECDIITEYHEKLDFDKFWKEVEERQIQIESAAIKSNPSWYIIKDEYEFSTSTEFS